MPDDARSPIPATCAQRPTVGGVVKPWVNVELADGGVDFRSQHTARAQRCWRERRCQVCAGELYHPIVFLGGPDQVRAGQYDEPPLHPECAVYTSRACPMVAGRLDRFADRLPISQGPRGCVCSLEGCDCGGWVKTPGSPETVPGGKPAHDWYAVYVTDYSLGVTRDNPNIVSVGVVTPEQVLTVRHVSAPGVGRTWKRTSRDEVRAHA